VPTDVLLDAIWSDRPPESGATALQVRVSQLRKSLERHGSSSNLETRPPGYVLSVDPDEVDVRRFERLVGEGRAALADQEAQRAAAILSEALTLWRGPALADVAYESFAQPEIARLEELRLTALEERLEADLACGRHEELVGELEALVALHPLRERPRRQLMLALYRSGRQAEALDAYRGARRALVEELGLEPSEELRQLEQAILRQDPVLSAPFVESAAEPLSLVAEERKVVTVLFADLVGSTALTASHDPERTRVLLDRYYEAMASEIEASGGTVEKFIGDAVMAVFGAPVAHEDHVERALHTALAMRRRLALLYGGELKLRIGVATGEVVVASGRDGGALVTGIPVNACARLEQNASPGDILVHSRTARAATGAFEFGPTIAIEVDGIREGLECRRLIRALARMRPRGLRDVEPVFVGRETELDLLCTSFRRVASELRPSLVTVVGAPGVGKSRLLHEFWEWLARCSPQPLRRTGRCPSYGRAITYVPLGEILREELGLLTTDAVEVAHDRLGDRDILGLALGADVGQQLHPLEAQEKLREAAVGFFQEMVARRSAVLLVEDIHWAQEPLLELIERLVREVQGSLMVVATARPEFLDLRPSWGRGLRDAATIWLEPLSSEDTGLLVEELLDAELPSELVEAVVERSGGNPFFAEELLGSLADRGTLVRASGRWTVDADSAALPTPSSVQAVLSARIDLLPPVEKAALHAAAVIGRSFWRGAVRELLDGASADLDLLEARDFVRRQTPSSVDGETEYVFKHTLTREVAYAGIAKARRARLHAGFAEWLAQVGAEHDDHASLLAHHYAEAVRADDADLAWAEDQIQLGRLRKIALLWLRRAGELAVGRYELDDAIALFTRALDLATGSERCDLYQRIGRANALKFDADGFWSALQSAASCAVDDVTRADYEAELAFEVFMRSGMWTSTPPLEQVRASIEFALEHAGPVSAARSTALVAKAFAEVGDIDEAAAEAWAIADELDDPVLRSSALDAQQHVATRAGDYERAWAFGNRRLELLDFISDPDHRADIVQSLIPASVATGRIAQARELVRLNDAITRPLTPHHQVHGVALAVGVEEMLGNWPAIAPIEERVLATVEANLMTPCTQGPAALIVCALAAAEVGDDARSRRLEHVADELVFPGWQVLDALRLRLALARDDLERADELLAPLLAEGESWYRRGHWSIATTLTAPIDALARLGRRDEVEERAPFLLGAGIYFEPFAWRALGVVRGEHDLVRQAAAGFAALGLDWHVAETAKLV
jgi:class 3 adenylate cyclase